MSLGHHIDHVIRGNNRWLAPHGGSHALYLQSRGLPAHHPGILPVQVKQSGARFLGTPVGVRRHLRSRDPLWSYRRRAPGRHHQPLRAADRRLAGLRVARSLCRGARGNVPI
jgi:hypothetical protein